MRLPASGTSFSAKGLRSYSLGMLSPHPDSAAQQTARAAATRIPPRSCAWVARAARVRFKLATFLALLGLRCAGVLVAKFVLLCGELGTNFAI